MQSFASSGILGGMDMDMGAVAAVGAAALEMDYAAPPFLPGMTLTVTPDGKNYGSPIAGLMGQEVTNIGLQESCKRPDTRRNYYTVTTGREDEKPVIVPESVLKPTVGSSEPADLEEGEVGEDGGEDGGEEGGEDSDEEDSDEEDSDEKEDNGDEKEDNGDEKEDNGDEKDNSDDAFEEAMDEANEAVEGAQVVNEGDAVVDVYEEAHVVNEGDDDVDDIYEETRAVNKADIEEVVKEVVEEAVEDDRSDKEAVDAVLEDDRSDKEAAEDNGTEPPVPPVPLMALEELQEHVDVGADAIEAKRRAICAAADAERRAAKEAYDAACAAIDEKWAAREAAELGPMVELQSFKSQCLAFKHAVSHSNAATVSHKRKRDEVECELAAARLAEQTAQEEICALREENVDLTEKNKRLKTINDTYYQELKTIS